jgi:hypothetical protein
VINKNCSSLVDQTLNESSVPAFRCEGWGGGFPFSADQAKEESCYYKI